MINSPNNQPASPEYADELQLRSLASGAQEIYKAVLGDVPFGEIEARIKYDPTLPDHRLLTEFSTWRNDSKFFVRISEGETTVGQVRAGLGVSSTDKEYTTDVVRIGTDTPSVFYTRHRRTGNGPNIGEAVANQVPHTVANELLDSLRDIQGEIGKPKPHVSLVQKFGRLVNRAS